MPKRDYKSYNVLEEELTQEDVCEKIKLAKQEHIVNSSLNKVEEKNQQEIEVTKEESKELEPILITEGKKDEANVGRKEKQRSKQELEKIEKVEKEERDKWGDMSFSAYKNSYQTKERSRLVRWSMRLVKGIIILMLLPLLGILAFTGVSILGAFLLAAVTVLGSGVFILGVICFISTQINASIMALGISAAIAALSLGGILFILFIMLMKCIIFFSKRYRKPHKDMSRKGAK